jgi:fumarylpyruvate hydrolase
VKEGTRLDNHSSLQVQPLSPGVVPIRDSAAVFPVGHVFCVGRNYAAHAREMGSSDREPPFFFTKSSDAVVPSGTVLRYPPGTQDFQYEGELVVALGGGGHRLSKDEAGRLIYGYAAGLDMTRRDLQLAAREKGRPWDLGKNFAQSAPVGDLRLTSEAMWDGTIELRVNNETKQFARLQDMIWSVTEILSYLSAYYELRPGDLVFTGTPAGVGSVAPGDKIEVNISGLPGLQVSVAT